ncbi:MAG: pyruvate, phosphate dikinase [archaeon]|nr:pyruvate, phosphate dikinase [archaeon]
MAKKKYIYSFNEGSSKLKYILGAKGASIAEMTNLGMPVSAGFTISCQASISYMENPEFFEILLPQIEKAIKNLEKSTGKIFGDDSNPLIVSVRSGSPISMPGILDTILNLGMNEINMQNLAKKTGNEWFALDAYRRFFQMFSDVTMGIDRDEFQRILERYKDLIGPYAKNTDLTTENLRDIIREYENIYYEILGEKFPQDPKQQLSMAIKAVFESWEKPRTKLYREVNKIPNFGTAVTIQEMIFGNMGNTSMTGVVFTRDPSTGESSCVGEYLVNAQGEDVTGGVRTPRKLHEMKKEFPELYEELIDHIKKLEKRYQDVQDIEFTVQENKLYLLQSRRAKRSPQAMVKIAIDLMKEGILSKDELLLQIEPLKLTQLLFKRIDEDGSYEILTKGKKSSPGAVTGMVTFDADEAEQWKNEGKSVIFLIRRFQPDDIHGLIAAQGIVTVHGGNASQAAVIARGMSKPAICGARKIKINYEEQVFEVEKRIIKKGDIITVDGSSGIIIEGEAKLVDPEISKEFNDLLRFADKKRTLRVRANADTALEAETAVRLGCEGIGLVRTERMFSAPERLPIVREMLFARSREERKKALKKIKPMQKEDFKTLFQIMDGKPVTIRLLDLPLHEFVPDLVETTAEVAVLRYRSQLGEDVKKELKDKEKILNLIQGLTEVNPMLGLRGCRLGLVWPEVNVMQIEAIFEAACELKEQGTDVFPEVLIPFVCYVKELKTVKEHIIPIADKVIEKSGVDLKYSIGTMIEVPRSAIKAESIAKETDFFSFGTNDLTQMGLAFEENEENKIISKYLEKGVIRDHPFEIIDTTGIGRLMKWAINRGRKSRKNLICGACGNHSSNPKSIEFFHQAGFNYISVPPYMVPIARLAAAQAEIKTPKKKKKK